TTPTPYQYVGAYGYLTEPLPNLMLLWHRWYDAGVGRFGSRDPIARQGVGAYRYVWDRPSDFVDPGGDVAPLIGAAIVVVVGGIVTLLGGCGQRPPKPHRPPLPERNDTKGWVDVARLLPDCSRYVQKLGECAGTEDGMFGAVQDCCDAILNPVSWGDPSLPLLPSAGTSTLACYDALVRAADLAVRGRAH
ncbi:MAG: RHS repeat-associated core domain-containing protein, partial [Armatimonadia bacterium]